MTQRDHQDSAVRLGDVMKVAIASVVTSLVVVASGPLAFAANNPIPGVDVIVKKKPSGAAMTVSPDSEGRFSVRLMGPGEYAISTACRQTCPAHTISGTLQKPLGDDANPPVVGVQLVGLLLPAVQAAREAGPQPAGAHFEMRIRKAGPVMLSGVLPIGDLNNDGRQEVRVRESPTKPTCANDATCAQTTSALQEVSTTPGTTAGTDDVVTYWLVDGRLTAGKQPAPEPQRTAGTPIQGVEVGLDHEPEGYVSVTNFSDTTGAYRFSGLPAGTYRVSLGGRPVRRITVGPDGLVSGNVVRAFGGTAISFDGDAAVRATSTPGGTLRFVDRSGNALELRATDAGYVATSFTEGKAQSGTASRPGAPTMPGAGAGRVTVPGAGIPTVIPRPDVGRPAPSPGGAAGPRMPGR